MSILWEEFQKTGFNLTFITRNSFDIESDSLYNKTKFYIFKCTSPFMKKDPKLHEFVIFQDGTACVKLTRGARPGALLFPKDPNDWPQMTAIIGIGSKKIGLDMSLNTVNFMDKIVVASCFKDMDQHLEDIKFLSEMSPVSHNSSVEEPEDQEKEEEAEMSDEEIIFYQPKKQKVETVGESDKEIFFYLDEMKKVTNKRLEVLQEQMNNLKGSFTHKFKKQKRKFQAQKEKFDQKEQNYKALEDKVHLLEDKYKTLESKFDMNEDKKKNPLEKELREQLQQSIASIGLAYSTHLQKDL